MKRVRLSIEEKAGQLFMVGFPEPRLSRETRQFINDFNPGFVILFSRNIESLDQTVELTNELHSLATYAPFIFIDQEGGSVVQFKEMTSTAVSHMALAATGKPGNAGIAARIIGSEMEACGCDGVLAPVLDVNFEEKNPIIGIRSFSDRPDVVIDYGREFYRGLRESGVAGCGKHFPGHGGTVEDSHLGIPVVNLSGEIFENLCLKPFSALIREDIDAIMTAHVLYRGISDEIATFSPFLVSRLLRKKMGFRGLVISDCLEMKAVRDHYSTEEILKKILDAGIDVITASHSLDFQRELHRILVFYVRKGLIPESRLDESLERILSLKNRYHDLENRKMKSVAQVRRLVRNHRIQQQNLADESVTLLRNNRGVIPIGADGRILVIEWRKVKATMSISQAEDIFMMREAAGVFYENVQSSLLNLDGKVPRKVLDQLPEFDFVIAGLYSRNPEMEILQAKALNQIAALRPDVIVVALGNPYDIKNFRSIDTYILTYGFRKVQIQALFKLIRGDLLPTGQLPVGIGHVVPPTPDADTAR